MATVEIASFANGAVVFQYDYHDGNKRILRVRCINNGAYNARGTLLEADGTIVAQATFLAGMTTQYNVAGSQILVDEYGDPVMPYRTNFEYPAP